MWDEVKKLGLSLFDPDFMILNKFLDDAKDHLKPKGKIHLVYSDLPEKLGMVPKPFIPTITAKKGYHSRILKTEKSDGEVFTVYELRLE